MDRRARDLFELVEHAIFVLEPDDHGVPRYAGFNRYARDILNKSEAEIIGLTAVELYPGRLGKVAFEHHEAALQSGVARSYEILLPLAAGQRRIRTSLVPELDAQGRVIRLIGSSTDISGNQIIDEMQAGVQTLNSEMEDFISLAAHDLRAPMKNVNTIADMLREDFHDMGDGKLDLIDMLEEVGAKAMKLIEDVLAHAQATSTVQENTQFEFSELLDEVMGLLDPMGLCEASIPQGLVEGDRTATQIILRNLIDNAIKNADKQAGKGPNPDPPPLSLKLSLRDIDGFYEVGVQDNGVGFSNSALLFLGGGKLFTDSGFGMLGVRRLIHTRGGTLTATNAADGSGALVAFSLPGKVYPPLPMTGTAF